MSRLLSEMILSIGPLLRQGTVNADFLVESVVNDSRRVVSGSLFVAIRGAAIDGHSFIAVARARGAQAVVVTDPAYWMPGQNIFLVSEGYAAYARLMEDFYEYPARRLQLAGITGTNGKTTIAFMLHRMLTAAGRRTGLISTVKYLIAEDEKPADRTTPEAAELQRLFAAMATANCRYAVMEVSSHALDQTRTGTAMFEVAVFTNLTGDHLDYHLNMENYYQAKKRLFAEHTGGVAVINTDDPWGKRLAGELSGVKIISYGQESGCDWRINGLVDMPTGIRFELHSPVGTLQVTGPIPGAHNAYNLTAALAAAVALGLDPEAAAASLLHDFAVPGRLQPISLPNGATAYVDYAHTDDALIHAVNTLRPLCRGRLITVFGCGGDRDRTKRPRMGAAAAAGSDVVIVTSDNPRSEEPMAIIDDILSGIPAETVLTVEPDRRRAIFAAVGQAGPDDLILIAGKGHEDYQEVNGIKHHFSDAETVVAAFAVR